MRGCQLILQGAVCVAALCLFVMESGALEAGAAKVEIVPSPGTPLDGDFSRRGRPATGTHDPLFVRALFLQEGETALFLVSADLFAITPDLRARVLDKAPSTVPRENIVLAATHTLNGPGGLDHSWLGRQRGGRFMAEELDMIAARFAEAMQSAYDRRTRASAGYAAGESSLVVNRFDPAAPVDGQLGVLRVDDSDGNPIALIANLGAAPQGRSEPVFSADFPGAFGTALEGMTATTAVAMFLNGASGDQVAAAADATQPFAEVLAGRVKALANEIKCREVTLAFSSAIYAAPIHSASPFYAADALFQVIEIDRLAMLFMPPIPRGASGLALRDRTLARGYSQCMVVAPANGYLGAVAPVETIALAEGGEPVYLGPQAAPWLVESATAPLSRGESLDAPQPAPVAPAMNERNGFVQLAYAGTATDIGIQRGAALRSLDPEGSSTEFPPRWLESAAGGVLGHWELARPAVSVESLALPMAGEAARAALRSVGVDTIEALAGMSAESGVPFARLWLRQLAPSSGAAAPIGPVGVAFAMGAGKDGIVAGQSIEWPSAVTPVVARVKPKGGHAYVIASLPWHIGGMAGVNDRGIAIAVTSPRSGSSGTLVVPAEALVAEILTQTASFDEAIALLSIPRRDFSGSVWIAFDDGSRPQSALVDLGLSPVVALDPVLAEFSSESPAPHNSRLQNLLSGVDAPAVADFERILVDRDRRAATGERILNEHTRACVVLVPRRRELRVMAPDAGAPRAFEVVSLRGDES